MLNNMVKYTTDAALDATFGALADPTRRAILLRLVDGEKSVTELAAPFTISLPAISRHLRVLEEAGLLIRRRDGRTHYLTLAPLPMQAAADWLAFYHRFWDNSLDALAELVEGDGT